MPSRSADDQRDFVSTEDARFWKWREERPQVGSIFQTTAITLAKSIRSVPIRVAGLRVLSEKSTTASLSQNASNAHSVSEMLSCLTLGCRRGRVGPVYRFETRSNFVS